jgi:serine/threonine protein kinase
MIEGRTLFKAIQDATSLEERMELLPSVIAAADAVAFAHANGIIHRDLTPANILLGDFGETVVIDWGLAKDLRVDLDRVAPEYQTGMTQQVLTAKGDVVGSPAYMPREQAAGEEIDARADVYALGAILYHLLSGRAPYQARSAKAIIQKVRAEAPAPLEKVALGAPRGLVAIVRKAMTREASGRHANAKELAAELRRFQAALVVGAHRGPLTRWLG